MAKTTRRPRTDDETTQTHDIRSASRQTTVTNSDIARRAYEFYEQRGGEHGRDLDDGCSQRTNCVRRASSHTTKSGFRERNGEVSTMDKGSAVSREVPSASEHEVDELCINTIRMLSIDAVQQANSGHPGMPMGAATMAYILWTRHLRHNPRNPSWPDRDRFVLSAGHASMLLYSLLFLTGYDLTMEDLEQFRQWKSRTPGHPERGHTPGVEVTTGPLGQGVGEQRRIGDRGAVAGGDVQSCGAMSWTTTPTSSPATGT